MSDAQALALLSKAPQLLSAELCRRSLREFVEQAWHVLEPGTPFVPGWHIDLICEHLEAVTAGEIKRLIINIPPRHMKSLLVSVMWPCWEWGPRGLAHLRYLFSSYAGNLSVDNSLNRRALLTSDWYQARWGRAFRFTEDNNKQNQFSNNKRGMMTATSTGGTTGGKGGQRVVADDPLNPEQKYSEAARQEANRHVDYLWTRLNDKQQDAFVIVMQRLHEADPAGHVLAKYREHPWTLLNVPAVAPERTFVLFPRSNRQVTREPGELIWAAKQPQAVIDEAKVVLGSYGFAGEYQQRPAPEEGGYIKRAWWKRFAEKPAPPYDQLIISTDAAFKDLKTGSKVATQVWAAKGSRCYLLDRKTEHMGIVQTIQTILDMRRNWTTPFQSVTAVLVEDKANGPAVIEMLGDKVPGLIPVEPRGSKQARAMAVAPRIEAGDVWAAAEPWADEVIDAWAFVPNGTNWDDVDAASQALDFLSRYEVPEGAVSFVGGQSVAAGLDFGSGNVRVSW